MTYELVKAVLANIDFYVCSIAEYTTVPTNKVYPEELLYFQISVNCSFMI
jgi:hypothetical protein